MATTEQLETRLDEAETALHALATGSSMETVEYEGHRTTFRSTPKDMANLRSYIADLKRQLGKTAGRFRAIGVAF